MTQEAMQINAGVDPAKLSQVFRDSGRLPVGASLGELRTEPIGTGQMADTLRCRVVQGGADAIPSSFVVKLPVAEGQTAVTARHAAVYDREFRFYSELRPQLPMLQCPEFYGSYALDGEPALVLEDVPGIQGDQIAGASPIQARQAVDQLAGLQSRWWDDKSFGRQEWLQRRAGVPIAERQNRYIAAWQKVRASVESDLMPGAIEVIEKFGEQCDSWSRAYSGPMCLVHHDFRLDNILFSEDRIWVVDWQTLGWGPPAWDLAYFLGSSLSVQDRRANERGLVARHADQLRALGVDGWTDEIAWDAYRQMAYGVFLLTMPAAGEVRTNERARQMYVAMWNRAATMVLDLNSSEFLEV
ncbi:phosphotransferase family protein [Gordonia lacunae]|uniref:phosphotransferase family protein n=1 Tax=Gordonia lacunae TaxID=417102 RepID=UPI0039E3D6D2